MSHDYYPARKKPVTDGVTLDDVKRTVRQRIEAVLHTPGPFCYAGGRWWQLAELQIVIHASSCRSRLQELMQDDRRRPGGRVYDEIEVRQPGKKAKMKIYRIAAARPKDHADGQGALFHVERSREGRGDFE